MTAIYQKSFLEKLLGRNYKWWFIVLYTFKKSLYYFWNELLSSIYRFIQILTVVVLAYQTNNSQDLIEYILIGSVFFAITEPFISWEIGEKILNGKISNNLLTPITFFQFYTFVGFARSIYNFLIYIPGLIILFVLFGFGLKINFYGVLWLLCAWWFSFFMRLMWDFISSFIAFWTTEFTGGVYFGFNLLAVLSGAIFPLSYLPHNMFKIIETFPFAYTFYHPMQIYLGKYDTNQTILVFVGGLIWCLVLYILALIVFKIGLKRNESVGL